MKTESVVRVRPRLKIFRGHPSLIPYISLFFILVLYFMMGTNFVPVEGISVDLPQGPTTRIYASKKLIITVDKESNIYFNDMLIPNIAVLKRQLNEILHENAGGRNRETLIIRADKNISLELVAQLMALREELNVNAFFMTHTNLSAGQNKANFLESEQ